jgi:hypothetical protein
MCLSLCSGFLLFPVGEEIEESCDVLMRDVQIVLSRLRQSPFRNQIHLGAKELDYLRTKGMSEVLKHAAEFIEKRLAPASPVKDAYKNGMGFQRGEFSALKNSNTLSR